jgi:hypothetical protein
MQRFFVACIAVVTSALVAACWEEPPPAHPEVPSPEELEAAKARRDEEQRQLAAGEAERQAVLDAAAAEEAARAKEKKAAKEAAQVEEKQRQADREAAARAAIDKLRPWVQDHVSWSFAFPSSTKITCTNAVNVSVPCNSAAAQTQFAEMTVNASATVRNNTTVPLRCQARFSFDTNRIFKPSQPKAVKNGSARFTETASFWLPTLWSKASTNGECVITIEDAAKIVEMPVEDLKALFRYQPSTGQHHGMSFMLAADIDGHTKPLEFFTVYVLSDDPNSLFDARVTKY